MTTNELTDLLGANGITMLRERLEAILPGRDLETLLDDGSAVPAAAELLEAKYGPDAMALVR